MKYSPKLEFLHDKKGVHESRREALLERVEEQDVGVDEENQQIMDNMELGEGEAFVPNSVIHKMKDEGIQPANPNEGLFGRVSRARQDWKQMQKEQIERKSEEKSKKKRFTKLML